MSNEMRDWMADEIQELEKRNEHLSAHVMNLEEALSATKDTLEEIRLLTDTKGDDDRFSFLNILDTIDAKAEGALL